MSATPKVIVVDDDYSTANLIKILLEMEGYAVTICTSREKAKAAADGVDLFIIDYYLERGENGVDLLHAIRRGETAADEHTPVVLVSGDKRREKEAQAAGANSFLLKPYPPNQLKDELKMLLSEENYRE